jgi:hypothetical protein
MRRRKTEPDDRLTGVMFSYSGGTAAVFGKR